MEFWSDGMAETVEWLNDWNSWMIETAETVEWLKLLKFEWDIANAGIETSNRPQDIRALNAGDDSEIIKAISGKNKQI